MGNLKLLYPIIITDRLEQCAEFYGALFGFERVFTSDWYIHLVQPQSKIELAFMVPNADNQPEFLQAGFTGNGLIISLEVADAAMEFERISKNKLAPIMLSLTEETWGQKHFILRDPSGTYVDIVEQIAQMPEQPGVASPK